MVVNSLVVERAHEDSGLPPLSSMYQDGKGLVVMCSHCRRTRRAAQVPEQWDWVPEYVAMPAANTSHSLCPVCLDYYYPVPE